MKNRIYEHLITKKKYNTLEVKFNVLQEELENKSTELNQLKRQMIVQKNIWETKLIEQEQEIIKLKKRKVKKQ